MAILKLLRNAAVYENHDAARSGLTQKMTSLGDGEIAIATYTSGDTKKTLFGIKNLGVVTYFDTESDTDALENAIKALDATVEGISTDEHVKVNIVETDGKLTSVTVTTKDIASAALLGTTSDDKTKTTAFGYIAKEADDRATAISQTVQSLKVEDSAVAKKFVTSVSETDGKISVSRGEVTSTDKTVTLSNGTDGGINLAVNVDGTTIIKDSTNGKLSVASSALTQYVGDKAISVSNVDEDNNKTISLVIPNSEKVLSQGDNGLTTTIELKSITPSSENVKEEYQLQGINGAKLGTDTIKVYKDQTLKSAAFANQKLTLTYILADGSESAVDIDMSSLVLETEVENGIQAIDHKLSIKLDTTGDDTGSDKFLTVGENGLKLNGVSNAIADAINALDVNAQTKTDTAGFVSTTISETDGKVNNDSVSVVYGDYDATDQKDGIAKTSDTKSYVDTAVANKNVSAEGDDYVNATASNNKVTVSTNVADLTLTPATDTNDSTLTGTSNKLVKNDDVAQKVSSFVNARISEEIAKLDATVGSTNVESEKHIAVQVVETDGKLTSVTVTESDIASATDLSNEIAARKAVDGQEGQEYVANGSSTYIKQATSLNDADIKLDAALKTVDDTMLTGVTGSDAITVSEKASKNQTITLKLDASSKHSSSSAADNALVITQNEGLYLSSVWDCGTY